MTTYLLKVIICSGILYAFYILFLEKEKMHVFNRFYLLGSLLACYIIPLITFEVKMPQKLLNATEAEPMNFNTIKPEATLFVNLIWLIVIIVSVFFLIRFVAGLLKLNHLIRENELTVVCNYAILVNIHHSVSPFSFGKYIFMNKEETDERILLHELTHIRQKHWIDNVLTELLISHSLKLH